MTEYLKDNPDTTTEEFDQVWRTLDPETKDVCPLCFSFTTSSHTIADLGQEEQGGEVWSHSYSRYCLGDPPHRLIQRQEPTRPRTTWRQPDVPQQKFICVLLL